MALKKQLYKVLQLQLDLCSAVVWDLPCLSFPLPSSNNDQSFFWMLVRHRQGKAWLKRELQGQAPVSIQFGQNCSLGGFPWWYWQRKIVSLYDVHGTVKMRVWSHLSLNLPVVGQPVWKMKADPWRNKMRNTAKESLMILKSPLSFVHNISSTPHLPIIWSCAAANATFGLKYFEKGSLFLSKRNPDQHRQRMN